MGLGKPAGIAGRGLDSSLRGHCNRGSLRSGRPPTGRKAASPSGQDSLKVLQTFPLAGRPKVISIRLAIAALVALATTPLAAQPITRQCEYKGEGKLGPLTVVFDEAALSVRVISRDGQSWRYQNGVTGPLSPQTAADDIGPVEQFVKLRAGQVEVGFKWLDDGSTGHLAHFDAAAFKNPARRCLWKSLWEFATG